MSRHDIADRAGGRDFRALQASNGWCMAESLRDTGHDRVVSQRLRPGCAACGDSGVHHSDDCRREAVPYQSRLNNFIE
jgi:hypothetical protein